MSLSRKNMIQGPLDLIGATMINAELVFNAGTRTLPTCATELGGRGVAAVKKVISIQGPPRSQPGQPPKIASGDLIKSIAFKVGKVRNRSGSTGRFMKQPVGGGAVHVTISANTDYAAALEFGRRGLGKRDRLAPRPYFRPVFHNKKFAKDVEDTVTAKFVKAEIFAARKRGSTGIRPGGISR